MTQNNLDLIVKGRVWIGPGLDWADPKGSVLVSVALDGHGSYRLMAVKSWRAGDCREWANLKGSGHDL